MFCKECGTRLSDDAQFCPNCGKEATTSMPVEKADSSPPKKKSAMIIGVGGALVLIAVIGIFFAVRSRSDKNMTEETLVQSNIATLESTETEALTDIPRSTVPEPEKNTITGKEYPFYAASLITLINEQTLPNGEIVKYISDPESNPFQFAICDINKDGKEELLLHLPYDTCETSGHFIYTENIENTGLEDLCSFNEDTVYYETGFVKEPVSYGESLSVNFNSFDIKMWDAGGFLDAGRVEAWEKAYMPNDFSGKAFPDSVDTDGNGTVYFISGELGIDYDNPVDDAEYREYINQFFGDGKEMSVPWLELTMENVEKVTGYTEERISTENIVPVYTGEMYDDAQFQTEATLSEAYEDIPYVAVTANVIGMEYETYLMNTSDRIDLPTDYLNARFSRVLPLIRTDDITYYGYYDKIIGLMDSDIYMIGFDEDGYITSYSAAPNRNRYDSSLLYEIGVNDTEPYIVGNVGDKQEQLLIWRLDNAYLVMAVALTYSNGELMPTSMTSVTISQDINGERLGLE